MPDDEVAQAMRWLLGVGGMVIVREGEVHVYRGPIHVSGRLGKDPEAVLVKVLSEARGTHERSMGVQS